ncbi:MAG TPA: bifunctional glutamate N-acetyltransferase/amino-acid acetyltransferase ArgJ [Firmicutes bacterium]|nr:bifunctional glutamate N-acetyltransferase/amino-acid acetyltransferase ArgJ [Bacillota bacterium]
MTHTAEFIEGGVTAAKGFTASGIHCGIRKNREKKDLALIFSDRPAAAAAVYTQNLVKGAPIAVTAAHLENGSARAVICNSGIANTCAADGVEKAEAMCRLAAGALGIAEEDVIVASTGVIGPSIDLAPIEAGMPALAAGLSAGGHADAARAIMTTDTVPKEFAVRFTLGGVPCAMGGIAKGSGMIAPNMATMLSFITTDAAIAAPLLKRALAEAAADTFNMLSVDGDTSTNDTLAILANGAAGNPPVDGDGGDYAAFVQALRALCTALTRALAADGEGATKLLECRVTGGRTDADARAVAKAVVNSALLKAAMFGADANWGRVLCAIGYSGAAVDAAGVDVAFSSAAGSIPVCAGGAGIPFSEEKAKEILSEKEIVIGVTLHDGEAGATAWGCDLTYDYVKINGDYRS